VRIGYRRRRGEESAEPPRVYVCALAVFLPGPCSDGTQEPAERARDEEFGGVFSSLGFPSVF
jgi:hypothetical protein